MDVVLLISAIGCQYKFMHYASLAQDKYRLKKEEVYFN